MVADPIRDDFGNGHLAAQRFCSGLIIDSLGQTLCLVVNLFGAFDVLRTERNQR